MAAPNVRNLSPVLLLLTTLFSLALILCALFMPHEDEKFDNEQSLDFTQGWKYEAADGTVSEVTFPTSLPENIPGGIRLTNTIPANSTVRINSIAKYSVFQHYRIFVGGKLIYSTNDPTLLARHFDKTSGTYWILQRLPDDCAGQEVAMEITSAYRDYRQATGTVILGTRASILFTILDECFGNFFIALLMMTLGLLFCIFFLLGNNRYNISPSCLYIGTLQFWIGAWEFSESGLLQLVTGNAIFGTAVSFMAMRMSAIALLVYFRAVSGERWRRWNDPLLYVLAAEAVVSAVLQLLQIRDFYETVQFYHVLLAIAMLTVVAETLLETFRYHNRSLRYLFLSMMIVAASAVYEIVYFYFKNGTNLGKYLNIGLVLFTFVVSAFEIRKVVRSLELAKQAVYFKKLADTDPLTGLANRGALREWLAQRERVAPEAKARLAVIVCDVDELKHINDGFGHQTGDLAICRTAEYMQDVFSENALCCRTGGDEFACVLEDASEQDAALLVERFLAAVSAADAELPFDYGVSVGYAFFDAQLDKDLRSTMSRADQQMYDMKRDRASARRAAPVPED